jgi:hypothetical protein
LAEQLSQIADEYDLTIVDLPAGLTDDQLLVYRSLLHDVVVIAQSGRTSSDDVQELIQSLRLARVYSADRERFSTLATFMPRLTEVLAAEVSTVERDAAAAATPMLVSANPGNGAVDVDPALKELTFTFDEPMLDRSWSVVGDPLTLPTFIGSPRYDKSRTVLTVPVELAPGRAYRFGLNSAQNSGFRSARGGVLQPVAFEFTTRQ